MQKMAKTLVLLAAALLAAPVPAFAEHFDNWQGLKSFTRDFQVCGIDSMDRGSTVNASISVLNQTARLRMTNMAGPNAALAAGDIEVRLDGEVMMTIEGKLDKNTGVLAAPLTSQQFSDFFAIAQGSHEMRIELNDGNTLDYITEGGMMAAASFLRKCLEAMRH